MDTRDKVAESNRIEGITRPPTSEEVAAHMALMRLDVLTVADIEDFVAVYQPGAKLRDRAGMNVRVGEHTPPEGGLVIRESLGLLLDDANFDEDPDPWAIHILYERLHPFMDGNGRSGRAIWYWMMRDNPSGELGFLHCFYYQTLSATEIP